MLRRAIREEGSIGKWWRANHLRTRLGEDPSTSSSMLDIAESAQHEEIPSTVSSNLSRATSNCLLLILNPFFGISLTDIKMFFVQSSLLLNRLGTRPLQLIFPSYKRFRCRPQNYTQPNDNSLWSFLPSRKDGMGLPTTTSM